MRITIIQDDGVVGVDGEFRVVDLSELEPAIRAIQFDTVKGAGHIEFDRDATIDVDVRDEEAEREAAEAALAALPSIYKKDPGTGLDTSERDSEAERAAGDDALNALQPINRKVPVARPEQPIRDFAPLRVYLDRWVAAEPAPAPGPTPEQLLAAELEAKRGAALRALDDARLAQAALDPNAPQAVKDYAVAAVTTMGALRP